MARGESVLKIQSCSTMSHRPLQQACSPAKHKGSAGRKMEGEREPDKERDGKLGGGSAFTQGSSEIWDVIQKNDVIYDCYLISL